MSPLTPRKKLHALRNDDELRQEAHILEHERRERLQGALNNVGVIVIYVIPGVIVILATMLLIHYIRSSNWSPLETALSALIGGAAGYLVRHFQEHGLHRD